MSTPDLDDQDQQLSEIRAGMATLATALASTDLRHALDQAASAARECAEVAASVSGRG